MPQFPLTRAMRQPPGDDTADAQHRRSTMVNPESLHPSTCHDKQILALEDRLHPVIAADWLGANGNLVHPSLARHVVRALDHAG